MFEKLLSQSLAVATVLALLVTPAQAVTIETVFVGNPGNSGEQSRLSKDDYRYYGGVDYVFNIGKYEVTAGQYSEFLNAVAIWDTYGLYDTRMDSDTWGCQIRQSGAPGSYTYSAGTDWADRPVNFVSWGDAARFANWMHKGQPSGVQDFSTTEDGSYYLAGATTSSALMSVTRKENATWVIPTEHEWYKAAYHKNDGTTDNYFDYPTSNDLAPSSRLIDPDPGNNTTCCRTIGSPYYRTEVGAHRNSTSPYGTFDQAGNVWEWTEAIVGSGRGIRGGSWEDGQHSQRSSNRSLGVPVVSDDEWGFRLTKVPEPSTATLGIIGLVCGMWWWRRR